MDAAKALYVVERLAPAMRGSIVESRSYQSAVLRQHGITTPEQLDARFAELRAASPRPTQEDEPA